MVLALTILGCCSPDANAQTKKKPAPAKKTTAPAGDPPGTNIIMGNLRTWYKKYANSEGVWGKTELARAFGYLHAYDWIPPDVAAKEKEANAASGVSDPDSIKSAGAEREKKRNYWRKDKKFMDALDLDTDEIINKDEFEAWAHDYAVEKASEIQQQKKAIALQQQAMMLQMQAMQASLCATRTATAAGIAVEGIRFSTDWMLRSTRRAAVPGIARINWRMLRSVAETGSSGAGLRCCQTPAGRTSQSAQNRPGIARYS